MENSWIVVYAKAVKRQSRLLLLLKLTMKMKITKKSKCNIGVVVIAVAFDLVTGVDFVVIVVYFLAVDQNIFFFS